ILTRAKASFLSQLSDATIARSPGLAVLFAIQSAERQTCPATDAALRRALDACYERRTLIGHASSVLSANFNARGDRIVTSSHDNTARVFDAATGESLITLTGHQKDVVAAEFSGDGEQIVTASEDGTARIWETTTGFELVKLAGHKLALRTATFSRDGARVLTASKDGSARVWNAS